MIFFRLLFIAGVFAGPKIYYCNRLFSVLTKTYPCNYTVQTLPEDNKEHVQE